MRLAPSQGLFLFQYRMRHYTDSFVATTFNVTGGVKPDPMWLKGMTWPGIWAIFLAVGWLLPNHYQPWIAFHTDAWIAWMFALAGGAVVIRYRDQVEWTCLTVTAAVVTLIPVAQYASGLILFSGQAWVSTAYLLGFLLSLLVGVRWEKNRPEQAINALFFAIGLACVVSVGMQLYQWLSLSGADIWIVPLASNRPFANLVQPNQMATFLLWGLIAIAWFVQRQKLGGATAVFLAMYFLFGLALTQSRTAILAIALVAIAGWYWRTLWYTKTRMWIAAGLVIFFIACLLSIGPLSDAMLFDKRFDPIERMSGSDIRLAAYSLFADAALRRPLWGYGWTSLGPVQLTVAENHVQLGGIFQQSHNIFLDLILWAGIPVGVLIALILLRWFFRQFKNVVRVEEALLVLFVGVVWWHAMLELPLHYAYMLLPTGLVMGVLGARSAEPVLFRTGRLSLVVLLISAACLLAVITRDYMRMEADFEALRFERAYKMQPPAKPPQTLVLSQLETFIRLGRMSARSGMNQQELNWMRDAADAFPSPSNQYVYTKALAINGFPDQAQTRMKKLSKVMTSNDYEYLGKVWASESKANRQLDATIWLEVPSP
jgi:O-antigen ligase